LTLESWWPAQNPNIVLHPLKKKSQNLWSAKWKQNRTYTHNIIFLKFSTIGYTSILQAYNWCLNLQPWQQPWQKLTKIFLCLQCKNLCTMFLAIGSPMSSIYAQHNLICGHSENCFINCTILTFCQCHLLEQLQGEMIRRLGATTHPCQGHRLFHYS
jgi:hypothetical protein